MCSAAVKTVSRPPRVRHLLAVRLLGLADLVGLAGPALCASLPTPGPAGATGRGARSAGVSAEQGHPRPAGDRRPGVQAMFDKDLAASHAITLAQWERRPVQIRAKELLVRVWQYWL
jgi:hypothetical protein